MSEDVSDDIKLVMKLERRLAELCQQSNREDKILKILNQLSLIRMTLKILEATHVGKTVNALRKHGGEVSHKSKELVKRWKKLLTPTETNKSNTSRQQKDIQIPQKEGPSGELDHSKKSDRSIGTVSVTNSSRSHLNKSCDGHMTHWREDVNKVVPNAPTSSSPINQRKRKGANIEENKSLSVALSKRSRTQVYSGKSTGLKYVPSLFDMCMNILTDNIDAIEEVGGIPFFILEPVLSKCTPTQLMRLEEYNPHFIEDSDGLWQKHCQKEFRGIMPTDDQTWRELYLERLDDREQRMKSITSSIRARQQAREEPMRKAAVLSTLAPVPSRRHRGGYSQSFHRKSSSLAASGGSGSQIMKQTMKMAKERHIMLSSKRGRK